MCWTEVADPRSFVLFNVSSGYSVNTVVRRNRNAMSIIIGAAAMTLASAAEKLVELTKKLDLLATDRRLREHILPIREEILRVKELVFEAKQAQLQEMTTLHQEHAERKQTNDELIATIHRLQLPDQQSPLEPLKEQILAFLASGGERQWFIYLVISMRATNCFVFISRNLPIGG